MIVCLCGSLSDFLAKSDEYVYKLADNLLDALTNGEHSRALKEADVVMSYAELLLLILIPPHGMIHLLIWFFFSFFL